MVGENFEIYFCLIAKIALLIFHNSWRIFWNYYFQIAKITFYSSTMVGENIEIYLIEKAKIALNCPPLVGQNFEIYLTEMAKIAFKLSMVGENF